MNYLTMASDASGGLQSNFNGYAYYIRDDSGTTALAWREPHGGNNSSDEAEVHAMVGAFERIKDRRYEGDTTLIYYCDNMNALAVLSGEFMTFKAKLSQRKFVHIHMQLMEIVRGMGITKVETRWVKGHVAQAKKGVLEEKRYYMNRWCDKNANMMMKSNRYHERYKEIT